MNVTTIVVRRADGRLFPATWPNTPLKVVRHLQALEHRLHCEEHLTYRATQAAMMDRFGERRSLGQVGSICSFYAWLVSLMCFSPLLIF